MEVGTDFQASGGVFLLFARPLYLASSALHSASLQVADHEKVVQRPKLQVWPDARCNTLVLNGC